MLRDELAALLARAWPELEIVAQARNGREAVALFEAHAPDICFLDVQMPGLSGVEAARLIGRRAHLVFVTAFDQYALQAFEQGVLDYLVKPVEPARLAETVARLQGTCGRGAAGDQHRGLAAAARGTVAAHRRRCPGALALAAGVGGTTLRLIPVEEIDFLRSDSKYTLVAWRGDGWRGRRGAGAHAA